MKQGQEVGSVILPASDQAAVVMEPSEQPFDLPASPVAAQPTAILGCGPRARRVVRRDQFQAVAFAQPLIQGIAVVSAVADQSLREVGEETLFEGGFDEFRFMRRSAGDADGERKTMAVCDRHDFTAFSAASRADSRAPFFALLKLASMKVSDRSILPRSRRSSASAVKRVVRVPLRRHCCRRRWQVW